MTYFTDDIELLIKRLTVVSDSDFEELRLLVKSTMAAFRPGLHPEGQDYVRVEVLNEAIETVFVRRALRKAEAIILRSEGMK